MKTLMTSALFVFLLTAAVAQDKYYTRNGRVTFSASTPLEKIEAVNDKGASVLDAATGQVEFSVLMKAFLFEKALMQEHFHENYVESDKYPKAVFKGSVQNLGEIRFASDGSYPMVVKGDLTLHGKTRPVEARGKLDVKKGVVTASISFSVTPADYDIEIPSLVREKIAKTVSVDVLAGYQVLYN
jgi:polyisoprenoid-binding protein YceI